MNYEYNDHGDYYSRDVSKNYTEKLENEVKILRSKVVDMNETYKTGTEIIKNLMIKINKLENIVDDAIKTNQYLVKELDEIKNMRNMAIDDLEAIMDTHCGCIYCKNSIPAGCSLDEKYGEGCCSPVWKGRG